VSYIILNNIFKEYESAHALRGVSMEIQKRQWVNIMGPSGSGKSTLLNIIGGLDTPSKGDVKINSMNVNALSGDDLARFRREKIGLVFQQSHLIPYLNAIENVMLAQYFHSMADEKEAIEALNHVGRRIQN
jgi:putative ABC transport system ATP-binding protein